MNLCDRVMSIEVKLRKFQKSVPQYMQWVGEAKGY